MGLRKRENDRIEKENHASNVSRERGEEYENDFFNDLRNSNSVCKIPVAGIFCSEMKERNYAIVIEQLNKMNLEA